MLDTNALALARSRNLRQDKARMVIHADSFYLDETRGETKQHQLKRMVVDGILSGRFQPGERMPSSRALAKHLGISRITVAFAYTDLVADDYLFAKGRSGYFVSETAPRASQLAPQVTPGAARSDVDWSKMLAHRQEPRPGITRPMDWQSYPYPFVYGQTDPTLFDSRNWRLCALQALGAKQFDTLTSDHYERDDPLLVEYIQRQILPRRGIVAERAEILITMGAQNALWLAAQLLLTQRRTAVIENPGYPGLKDIILQTRCRTVPVDVDRAGLPPDRLPQEMDVLFATVSHQCPTNATLSLERRRALLDLARERNFVIVEDDYEFELAFERSPSPSLKSLDARGVVLHIGSFSKSLFPGLRLGYLVAPPPVIAEARRLRGTVLRHPPGLVQRTAATFLSLGHYDAQINRMRRTYQRRRAVMRAAIDQAGLTYGADPDGGGSCFWMRAPVHVDTARLAEALYPRGVVIEPGGPFFAEPEAGRSFYRLAYSSIPSERIPDGIAILAETIADLA